MDHSIRFATSIRNLFSINYKTMGMSSLRIDRQIRHSYYDWFLVPTERWAIEPPECKTSYIDIGGSNGSLDMSDAVSGYPVYKNRDGQMRFKVRNDRIVNEGSGLPQFGEYEAMWNEIYRDILMFLNGKKVYMMLEDDPEWYYYGRFSVGRYDASDKSNSEIVISYNLQPYKRLSWLNEEDLYWDILPMQKGSQENGFTKYENTLTVTVDTNDLDPRDYILCPTIKCGSEPVVPKIVVNPLNEGDTPSLSIRFWNDKIGMQAHTSTATNTDGETDEGGFIFTDRQVVLTNFSQDGTITPFVNEFNLDFRGHAKVSLIYEIGVL